MSENPLQTLTLETAIGWARDGRDFDKVYRFLFLHPEDLFTVPPGRRWPIAHQIVYHGNTELFKRILGLFSDDQINIRTPSNDRQTLLDVAQDRRSENEQMYTYIEYLFLQDDLIQAAEGKEWSKVIDILKKHPELANEKPLYSTYFLLHYVVKNGDKDILENLLQRFQFQKNVLSADNETPACLAKRLKKDAMYSILEPTIEDRSDSDLVRYRSLSPPLPRDVKTSDEKLVNPTINISSPGGSSTPSLKLPYPTRNMFPGLGFHNITVEIGSNGNFIFPTSNPSNLNQSETPSIVSQQRTSLTNKHVTKTQTLLEPNPDPSPEPRTTTPITPATQSQILKHITCPLTREIFVDPVIANDGQTYERAAIAEWISLYHCSPTTGRAIDSTFEENTVIKEFIQSMRMQN